VFAVDNGSTDGVPQLISDSFPSVRLIEVGRNLGFAAGSNLGIDSSESEIVLLLNSDVVVRPGFIREMLAPFAESPQIGAVAAALVYQRNPAIVASAGIEVYRNGLALDRSMGASIGELVDRCAVFGASGGAAAYRRRALVDVGNFPEPFFMYLEDVDLAWRLRLRGWDTVLAAKAVAEHASSAFAVEGSPFKRNLLARNRIWMLVRCLPSWFIARNWLRIALYDSLVIASSPIRKDGSSVRGRFEAVAAVRSRFVERQQIQARITSTRSEIEPWIRADPRPADLRRLRQLSRESSAT
jgi:GT2 family glycosyltransferase